MIALALCCNPSVLLADEPTTALDVTVQIQILLLLRELQRELGMAVIFVTHDVGAAIEVSDRVVVMYLGRIVEAGSVGEIFRRPRHPYSQALLRAMPSMDPDRRTAAPPLIGDPPNPINPPSGCRFRTRCAFAEEICVRVSPRLDPIDGDHEVACHMTVPGSGHSRSQTAAGD